MPSKVVRYCALVLFVQKFYKLLPKMCVQESLLLYIYTHTFFLRNKEILRKWKKKI